MSSNLPIDLPSDRYYEGTAVVTLPDGRAVRISIDGYVEGETNAWADREDPVLEWVATDEELTADECNVIVGDTYLHSWVFEHADFEGLHFVW